MLRSAASIRHELFACGNPLLISLDHGSTGALSHAEQIQALVATYFAEGGFQLHFNLVSAETLRAAQREPDAHRRLLVRISGYSARFTELAPRWQDALIERTARGI